MAYFVLYENFRGLNQDIPLLGYKCKKRKFITKVNGALTHQKQ